MRIKKNARKYLSLVIALSFFLWFFESTPIMGKSQKKESSLLIKEAFDEGKIDKDSYLLHQVQAIFAPKTLPKRFKSMVKTELKQDFTPLLKEIRLIWGELKEDTKGQLERLLIRPTDKSYSPFLRFPNMAYTVTEATPFDTEHFMIHYVSSTADAPSPVDSDADSIPDYVEEMGATFENVYFIEIKTMGYAVPPNDSGKGGNDKFDVYIKNIGGYKLCGWADPEGSGSGSSWYSFMVMDNDYSKTEFDYHTPLENLQVTAAHEFHHSVQFGYNVYTGKWLMEATSTWIEDEVYNNVNDNIRYLENFFYVPNISLDSTENDHDYSSWIWNRCLSERRGSNIIRDIWDKCKLGLDYLAAISQVLTERKTNLTDAFVDFTARNYIKTGINGEPYKEGSFYPEIYIENNWSPHNVYPVTLQTKSIDHLASRYIKFLPQSGTAAKTLQISFDGPDGKDCGACVVIKTKDGRLIYQRINLDDWNNGSTIVPDFGAAGQNYADVESAVLIMNNTTQANDGLRFSYSAQYLDGEGPQVTTSITSTELPGTSFYKL